MSLVLKKRFKETQSALEAQIKNFPWENKKAYGLWLSNSYHYALNSTRILALASGTMPLHLTKLSNRFITHAAEEKGHEKLLENDIKNLGFEMKNLAVSDEMKVYYRSLYYWMTPAGQSIGLIGWILSLEGLATLCGPWLYSKIKEHHGEKAASFLKVHSDADPDHLDKAFEITTLLSPEEVEVVIESMEMYSKQYLHVLSEIEKANPSKQKNAS